jgi:epoxyqueuosine reductase QueG
MNCDKWDGNSPETIVACRRGLNQYSGCVVAVCGGCQLACVWDKRAWAGKIAKDFSKRKVPIGRLKMALREVKIEDPIFITL